MQHVSNFTNSSNGNLKNDNINSTKETIDSNNTYKKPEKKTSIFKNPNVVGAKISEISMRGVVKI